MAHGLNSVLKRGVATCKGDAKGASGGSRRIFAPHFKLQVLDSYRNDADCKGNQRATARKYGIHRRQIQKWLQVENNLRNSVGKTEENPTRQPGDQSGGAPSSVAVELGRTYAAPDPQAPMDLSLKRPQPAVLVPPITTAHHLQQQQQQPIPPTIIPSPLPVLPPSHSDVWDLSIKRKSPEFTPLPPKPVKLFKPYLDEEPEKKPAQLSPVTYCHLPCCCPTTINNNNNNNNDCTIPNNNIIITTTTTTIRSINNNDYNTYILHEMQPNNNFYYYPTPPPEYEPYAPYDQDPYSPSYVPLKQRHSYSLDFKLKTIDSYYQDSTCKGNQRAVATKYNIHRRQVQKWLKQADELRQRNETIKQTQIVT